MRGQMNRELRIHSLDEFSRHIRQLIGAARETPAAQRDPAEERRLHQALALLWAAADTLERPAI